MAISAASLSFLAGASACAIGTDLATACFALLMRPLSMKPSSRIVVLHEGHVEPTANLPVLPHFSFGQELSFVPLVASND
jgi:hypothetical protein